MDARFDPDDGLLREHVEGVRRLAGHLVRDTHDAEDVAQESLLAAARRLPHGVRNLRAWLRGIVRHKALDFNRAEGRRRRHEGGQGPLEGPAATDDVVAHLETQERVVAAVRSLPATYRNVLWLRYFKDTSARDIARLLDVPVETVRTRIKRGLARLKTTLDEQCGGRRDVWKVALLPILEKGGLSYALALKGALAVMTTKTAVTCAAIMGVVALAAVPFVLGVWSPDSEPGPAAEEGLRAHHTQASESEAPPQLRGDGTVPASAQRVIPETESARGRVLGGRVVTPGGGPAAEAHVYVVDGPGIVPDEEPPWRLLGQAVTDEHGRYEIRFDRQDAATDAAPRGVLAIAEADGYVRDRQRVTLKANRMEIDLHLSEGIAFEGFVRDSNGRPLADLPVRVATFSRPPHMMHGAIFWSEPKRLATDSGTYIEARARTDVQGRFQVHGLSAGRYGVISEDLRWFVEQENLVDVDATYDASPVTYLAVPARAVMGTVRDATTGEKLPKGLVEFMLDAPGGDSMGSYASMRDGRFLAGWTLDDELQGRVDVKATASARGYRRAGATGVIEPNEPILSLDFALEPITLEKGTVVLTATDPTGAPLPGRIWIHARHRTESGVQLQRRPAPEGLGLFRFTLPAGTYDVFVRPFHVLGEKTSGQLEVTVLPNEEVQATVTAGGGATVRLRLPLISKMPASSMLQIEAVGERTHRTAGASTDLSLEEEQILAGEELVWTGFLPGTWRFKLHWGKERIERTIRLVKGDDQLLDFR